MPSRSIVMLVPLLTGLLACSGLPTVPDEPLRFREVPPSARGDFPNWPEKPYDALTLIQRGRVTVEKVGGAGAGTTGAEKIEVRFLDVGDSFAVKAKEMPGNLDGINNNPRRELAAWELQHFFLDPEDFTVPTVGVRCVPLALHEKYGFGARAQVPGTRCVLAVAALWLEGVTVPEKLLDPQRFLTEPRYAYHLANFNIFTYLIDIRDNRRGNILVSKDEQDRRVFAIDNGVSFGTAWYNWFWPATYAWREIRVPALPKRSVDRLRALEREDLDALAVLIQLEADDDRILWPAEPGPPIDEQRGVRTRGTTVQFGLTRDEIDAVWKRIEALLEDVDSRKISLF